MYYLNVNNGIMATLYVVMFELIDLLEIDDNYVGIMIIILAFTSDMIIRKIWSIYYKIEWKLIDRKYNK